MDGKRIDLFETNLFLQPGNPSTLRRRKRRMYE
jgi:hypothetical protein